MKGWHLLLLACLVACGKDSSGPARVVPDKEFAFDDPVGDTALFAGHVDSFPALDARRVSGVVGSDSITLMIEFVDPIVRANTPVANSLIATIAIDADDDGNTGLPLDQDFGNGQFFTGPFPARTGIGAEFLVFVDSISGSNAEVYSILTNQSIATFPMTYGENSATMQIPLAVFGIRPGAPFRVVGVVGNPQRLTDIIPDEGNYEVGGES